MRIFLQKQAENYSIRWQPKNGTAGTLEGGPYLALCPGCKMEEVPQNHYTTMPIGITLNLLTWKLGGTEQYLRTKLERMDYDDVIHNTDPSTSTTKSIERVPLPAASSSIWVDQLPGLLRKLAVH